MAPLAPVNTSAGELLSYRICGHGPALLMLDVGPQAEAWLAQLARHYRVICCQPVAAGEDSEAVAEELLQVLCQLQIHNPHLLVGPAFVAIAVALLTRPQDRLSWRSAVLISAPSRLPGRRWSALWRRWLAQWRCSGRQLSCVPTVLDQHQALLWRRALLRNQTPCRVLELTALPEGDQLWQLFAGSERLPLTAAEQLGEALLGFHQHLRQSWRQSQGL